LSAARWLLLLALVFAPRALADPRAYVHRHHGLCATASCGGGVWDGIGSGAGVAIRGVWFKGVQFGPLQ